MTVAELIAALEHVDLEAEVLLIDGGKFVRLMALYQSDTDPPALVMSAK